MPFTPSHAIVALPFVRTPLIPGAIAVGAMTPDLPLFMRGTPLTYTVTHTWAWLALTMSVALALLLAWRIVLRPCVAELLPTFIAYRIPPHWQRSSPRDAIGETLGGGARHLLLLASSLAVGVASHLVWDAFTHEHRWGTDLLPLLYASWGPLLGYKWLQHGSSVLGLLLLLAWGVAWLTRRPRHERPRVVSRTVRAVWWCTLPAALLAAWKTGYLRYGPFTPDFTVAHLGYQVLPPTAGAWGAVTLVLCLVIVVMQERSRSEKREKYRDTPGRQS